MKPGIAIHGAEPVGADDAARSLSSGTLLPLVNPNTICDGLRATVGNLPWSIISSHVDSIITVEDEDTVAAMKILWERCKMVVESSSSTVLAATLSDHCPLPIGSKVGMILSGGNVDLEKLPL